MRQYLVGYSLEGHALIEAANPQAASAIAIAAVRNAQRQLETVGEVEYRCPDGGVIDVTKSSRP